MAKIKNLNLKITEFTNSTVQVVHNTTVTITELQQKVVSRLHILRARIDRITPEWNFQMISCQNSDAVF